MFDKKVYDDGVCLLTEMEAARVPATQRQFLKKIGATIGGFFSATALVLVAGMKNIRFRLTYLSRVYKLKSGIKTGDKLHDSQVIKEINASQGVFRRYKYYGELKQLTDYLRKLDSKTIEKKLGKGYAEEFKLTIKAFDLLEMHKTVNAYNMMYYRSLYGKVAEDEFIAFNPYVMTVIALTYNIANCVKLGLLAKNVDEGRGLWRLFRSRNGVHRPFIPFTEQLDQFVGYVNKGIYHQYVKSCINSFEQYGRISSGVGEETGKADMEAVGGILAGGVIITLVTSFLLISIQFCVFYVYFIRGRIAIMLNELIKEIESEDDMDPERKKKRIENLRKAYVKIDIDEHEEVYSKATKTVDKNVKKAVKKSKTVKDERDNYDDVKTSQPEAVDEDDDDMDLF
jgi:hypothetical protein